MMKLAVLGINFESTNELQIHSNFSELFSTLNTPTFTKGPTPVVEQNFQNAMCPPVNVSPNLP
jgi:hypothetical protein